MADAKQEKLTNLVLSFCREKLKPEHEEFAIKLIRKMARKRVVPFHRGKIEIWASGIVYAIAMKYSLFDKSADLHLSVGEICDYYKTNKSTVYKKAVLISDMFNLKRIEEPSKKSSKNKEENNDFFAEINELYNKGEYKEALNRLDTISEDDEDYSVALFYKSILTSYSKDNKTPIREKKKKEFEPSREHVGDNYDFLFEDVEVEVIGEEEVEKEYDEFFLSGLEEFNAGNYEDAVDLFDLAATFDHDESEIYYYKALALGFLNDYENAVEEIDKALMIDYDDYRFWNDKGNFLTKLGDDSKAEKCFNHAIELKPDDAFIFANKGAMYLNVKKFEEALECFEKAHQLDSSNIDYILSKFNVYIILQDFKKAEEMLDEASKIDKNNLNYLIAMSHYLASREKFEEAIFFCDRCLEINGELAEVWLTKALMNSYLNNNEEYERCIEQASQIDPLIIFSISDEDDEEF